MKPVVNSLTLSLCLMLSMHLGTGNAGYSGAYILGAATAVAQAAVSAQEAAALVQARTGGRILAVETINVQGRIVYRVKVLTPDGEVRIFFVDAATGAM